MKRIRRNLRAYRRLATFAGRKFAHEDDGAIIVYSIFFLIPLLSFMFVVYNAGVGLTTRMRAQCVADAAAYSNSVWQARFLNYTAYTRRHMVSNYAYMGQSAAYLNQIDLVHQMNDPDNFKIQLGDLLDMGPLLKLDWEFYFDCGPFGIVCGCLGLNDPDDPFRLNILTIGPDFGSNGGAMHIPDGDCDIVPGLGAAKSLVNEFVSQATSVVQSLLGEVASLLNDLVSVWADNALPLRKLEIMNITDTVLQGIKHPITANLEASDSMNGYLSLSQQTLYYSIAVVGQYAVMDTVVEDSKRWKNPLGQEVDFELSNASWGSLAKPRPYFRGKSLVYRPDADDEEMLFNYVAEGGSDLSGEIYRYMDKHALSQAPGTWFLFPTLARGDRDGPSAEDFDEMWDQGAGSGHATSDDSDSLFDKLKGVLKSIDGFGNGWNILGMWGPDWQPDINLGFIGLEVQEHTTVPHTLNIHVQSKPVLFKQDGDDHYMDTTDVVVSKSKPFAITFPEDGWWSASLFGFGINSRLKLSIGAIPISSWVPFYLYVFGVPIPLIPLPIAGPEAIFDKEDYKISNHFENTFSYVINPECGPSDWEPSSYAVVEAVEEQLPYYPWSGHGLGLHPNDLVPTKSKRVIRAYSRAKIYFAGPKENLKEKIYQPPNLSYPFWGAKLAPLKNTPLDTSLVFVASLAGDLADGGEAVQDKLRLVIPPQY